MCSSIKSHTPSHKWDWNILGGGGESVLAKKIKCMKLNRNFQRGGGS